MASTLPPDPYKALGLTRDAADAATIKSTYRKLVLKCHPDKVNDESLKKQKQEEFHKIQQAYELIGDEEKRQTYDAEVRLDFLRREKANRIGPSVDVKTARYEVRTAAPAGAASSASGPSRYEERERKSPRSFEEDRFHEERARKFDTYDPYPKYSSSRTSRTEKELPIRVTRVSSDRTRSDTKKTRDREERRDRSNKFVHIEDEISSNDEKARYEADYRRRSEDARRMKDEEEAKRAAAEARRKADDRRSYEDPRYDRQRKLSDQESEAMRHMFRTKTEVIDPRPSASRTTSRDVRPETYDRSTRREVRPEQVRRSSARPKEVRTSSSGRDRDRKGIPEIVDWGDDDRKPPSFKQSSSSPADIHLSPSRVTPQRAYTEVPSRDHRVTESSPSPVFRRCETMPVSHSPSSRRKEPPLVRPSLLRSSETLAQHEPSSRSSPETAYPTVPPPQSSSSKKYYYPTSESGVRLSPHDLGVASGHRTVLHEPTRHVTRSPPPLSRPPMGSNRPSEISSIQYTTTPSKLSSVPPPLGRTATMNISPSRGDDRGRSRPSLYGEIPKRENARRQASFSPEEISYSKKIGPEDVRWSRGREPAEKGREYAKPTLTRHATYVY